MGCCKTEDEKQAECAEKLRDSLNVDSDYNQVADMDRGITDIIPLLVFLAFLFGMGVVGTLAIQEGDIARIQYGMDFRGNTCGSGDRSSYSHQYWPNVLYYKKLGSVCLESCPSSPSSFSSWDTSASATSAMVCTCSPKVAEGNTGNSGTVEALTVETSMNANYATSTLGSKCNQEPWATLGYYRATISTSSSTNDYYKYMTPATTLQVSGKSWVPLCNPEYRTETVLNRCMPWIDYTSMITMFCDSSGSNSGCPDDNLSDLFSGVQAFFEEAGADLATCWYVIVTSLFMAIAIGFLYLWFMKVCATCVLWCGLLGTIAGTALVTFAFYVEYGNLKDRVDTTPQLASHDEDQQNMYICLAFAILFGLICAIVTCVVVCFCRQVSVAGKLLACAADAMLDMPMLVFYPFGLILTLLCFFALFFTGAIMLFSAGTIDYNSTYGYAELEHDESLQRAALYWVFGFLWICEFISAVGFMVVSFCFAMWFFSPRDPSNPNDADSRKMVASPICTAIKKTLCNHLGTVAFGSFIIAVIQMLRLVVEYLEHKKEELEKAGVDLGCLWNFIFCCCRCCLWCFEKCMKYINKVAYVLTVIKGSNFLSSACSAIGLLTSELSYIAVVSGISSCMLMFGKFACALIVAAISGYWASTLDVSSVLFPVLVTLLIGYAIAMLFAEVYEMAVDTMLICFLHAKQHGADAAPPAFSELMAECEKDHKEKTSKKDAELAAKKQAKAAEMMAEAASTQHKAQVPL